MQNAHRQASSQERTTLEGSLRKGFDHQARVMMDGVGVDDLSSDQSVRKDQIEQPSTDTDGTRASYDLHMMDVIFGNYVASIDHPSPSTETQRRFRSRVEPLYDAFVCPLTKQVMLDPISLESGQTYERKAIECWFKQCQDDGRAATCPMTGKELECTALRPSLALRNAIQEWTARNEMARIDNARIILTGNSSEEDIVYSLTDLNGLCARNRVNKHRIRSAGLIPVIVELLKLVEQVRITALTTLRIIAEDDDENKEAIGKTDAIRNTLKCLSRAISEEREGAAALLLELSKSLSLCSKIGKTNGAILYLVGITSSKSDNVMAVKMADETLENLERSDENVRQMAENGRVQPLLRCLLNGDENVRIAMATDLGEVPLTSETLRIVAEQAARVLVEMLGSSQVRAREAALRALLHLSTLQSNSNLLIEAGLLPHLMRDLFMIRTVEGPLVGTFKMPMGMKEMCASILANVVNGTGKWQTTPIDAMGNTLISESIVHNLLHLISNTGPNMGAKLLQVLIGLALPRNAVADLVTYIHSAGATISLINFLEAPQEQLRIPAIRLLHLLSSHMGKELADGLTRQLGTLLRLLNSNSSVEEQAAAAGILSNLPVEDFGLTRAMHDIGAIPILITQIQEYQTNRSRIGGARYSASLQEGLVATLARFAFALHDPPMLALAMQYDLCSFFTALLQTSNLDEVQRVSALVLEKLSYHTPELAQLRIPTERTGLFSCIFHSRTTRPVEMCPVHEGVCSSKETFCLLDTKAVDPLVSCLDHRNVEVVDAALAALSTLLLDDVNWDRGVRVLHGAEAIRSILDILEQHRTDSLRQRSLWTVERILRNADLAKLISGEPNVHPALVDSLRHGNTVCHSLAEKCLRHINKIPTFSGVFEKVGSPRIR